MFETVITLPGSMEERGLLRLGQAVFRHITPDHISQEELVSQLNDARSSASPTHGYAHQARIDMLSTACAPRSV
jgi:hypothetical protein